MEFLSQLLKEKSGKPSSKRLMSLAWFILLCIVWVSVSIKAGEMSDIPDGVYMISGIILGAQAVGKFGEK